MVSLEITSTFAFQGARWLGDIAPRLLTEAMLVELDEAKKKAARRIALEHAITPGMLYVRGWPTRMLTDGEATLLAGVRAAMAKLMGIEANYLDAPSIHRRYAELMAENERKKTSAQRDPRSLPPAKQRERLPAPPASISEFPAFRITENPISSITDPPAPRRSFDFARANRPKEQSCAQHSAVSNTSPFSCADSCSPFRSNPLAQTK